MQPIMPVLVSICCAYSIAQVYENGCFVFKALDLLCFVCAAFCYNFQHVECLCFLCVLLSVFLCVLCDCPAFCLPCAGFMMVHTVFENAFLSAYFALWLVFL